MRTAGSQLVGLALALFGLTGRIVAQEPALPPADRAPQLVVQHAGPHAPVRALAFAPDASTLYVGGFDKQVWRYRLVDGTYVATDSFRVPLGPGNAGVVNAVAVSPDGKWVAVAGRAPIRGEVWAGPEEGIVVEEKSLSRELTRDAGVVYLFDPANPNGGRVIRGQESEVRALAFANPAPVGGAVLVTAGIEWDKNGKRVGTVRAFDVMTGAERGSYNKLPGTEVRPGLAAWATGPDKKGVRVAVSWLKAQPGQVGDLLLWDVGGGDQLLPELINNTPLAVRVGPGGAVKLITGGVAKIAEANYEGRLVTRLGDPVGKPSSRPLPAGPDTLVSPLAVAAVTVKSAGDATAVLVQVSPPPPDTTGRAARLLLIGDTNSQPVPLTGLTNDQLPVLAASPDGRFLAVAGFSNHRVEVYDTTAIGTRKPQELKGGPSGFAKVAFLAGEKLWLGKGSDTPEKGGGGVVLDLDRTVRTAMPRGAKDQIKIDAPDEPILKLLTRRITVTVGGVERTVTLPDGERATAVAFLPGKPVWDIALGPILAIAQFHDGSQRGSVVLYDPISAKALLELGGPTRPVKHLTFSGTRPLLAGAGDDGTIAVWGLKKASATLPAIEGLLVTERNGKVVVASVQAGSSAVGKLNVGDEIESVADATGAQKPVKVPSDFVFLVSGLKVGANAQIKVKGRAAVAVPVGVATGFRQPLFNVWVDPVAKDGKHDWVGWTTSGPYDTNGEAGEAHIGWVTATGIPERPVTIAPAAEYRKLYYKRDQIRQLLGGDRVSAPDPQQPKLTATLAPRTELVDGLPVVRESPKQLKVSLSDPDSVLDPDRLYLRWQIRGPGGTTEWAREPFSGARAALDLSGYQWKRGDSLVHVQLFNTAPAPASDALLTEVTVPVRYRPPEPPPPPQLVVKIDGAVRPRGIEYSTENEEFEVAVTVDAKANPKGARVTVSWTGGGEPVEFRRNDTDTYAPRKVKLAAGSAVTVLVTATNLGEDAQSSSIEVRVRRPEKVPIPPPSVELRIDTPHDLRTTPAQPFVVIDPTVTVTATVVGTKGNPVTEFEWRVGGEVVRGELDPKTNSQTRQLTLPPNRSIDVRVRAKSAGSAEAVDCAVIRYDGLPEVSLAPQPALVTESALKLSGELKVASNRAFMVRLQVTGSRTGQTREFETTIDPTRTSWECRIALFPGENRIGYALGYDEGRKRSPRTELVAVQYVRPPTVARAEPIEVGTGAVGAVHVLVLSPRDLPPKQLWVNGGRVDFRAPARPATLFGAAFWTVRAEGVAVGSGPNRLKPVEVMVRNAEAESPRVFVEVHGRAPVSVPPPVLRLGYKGGVIPPDSRLPPVGEQVFGFELAVSSETRLTKVEVWHVAGGAGEGELVPGVKLADAVARPEGGFVLSARPEVRLRPGPDNRLRVVVSNESGSAEATFMVSFTPPAVRVVIESIRAPNGEPIPVAPNAKLVVAAKMIAVTGRVEWDFDNDPLGRDENLEVVFFANGVAHRPVPVAPALRAGEKKRTFVGRVDLNALDPNPAVPGVTRVRVELRSGGRPMAIPQSALSQPPFTVTSTDPLRKQRLHLLVVGVKIPKAQRQPLIANVIRAVGGTIPAGATNFTEGPFDRTGFDFAYLYMPQLENTTSGDLNTLLNAVRNDIEERTKQPGEEWVNDVIVVYYQGTDWVDQNGWFLHSAETLGREREKGAAGYAIRLDNLPQSHGLPIAVVNVAGGAIVGDNLAVTVSYVRTAWKDALAGAALLPELAEAIRREKTFDGVLSYTGAGLMSKGPQKPLGWLPRPSPELGARYVGVPKP